MFQGHHAGNLVRHFFTQHRAEYDKIQERTFSDKDVNSLTEYNKVLECCINLVAIHGRPLSLLEDEAFQNLITMIPNPGLKLNIRNIRTCIENKAYDVRKKIYEELKNKLVCLKIDVASVKSRRFLGINLQFILDKKLQLRNLCVVELHERNTAAFLKDTVLMVLSRYGIEPQQLYSITSDNGANMLAMSRQIEEEIQDSLEDLNNTEEQVEESDIIYSPADGQEMLDLVESLEFERENIAQPIVTAVRCAAHTLQLAVRDACKELEPVFELCRRAVRTLRTPNVVLELKRNQLLQAILDCPTRWDSTADMLDRLVNLKDFCKEHYSDLIGDETWSKIEESLQALKPCRVLSKRLQEEQLTFGDFYIYWIKCITELEQMNTPIALYLVICMKAREGNLLTNDTFLSAVYMDPRVNSILSEEQNERARIHLMHTHQRYINLQLQTQDRPTDENDLNQDNVPHTSRSNIDGFFERRYRERQRERPTEACNQLKNSLIDFLNSPLLPTHENILKYWYEKRFTDPQLYSLSTIALATPPTQVSVERLFSSLKFILNNLRMSLKDSIIDDILLVRNNSIYEKSD